jgi:hypothetical protein
MFDAVIIVLIFRMVMDKSVEKNCKRSWEELMIIYGKKYYKCVTPTMMDKYHNQNLLIF